MKIMVRLENERTARTISRLLDAHGHFVSMPLTKSPADWFTPDVLLVDITNLRTELLARYPKTNVFLIDAADVKPENLYAALLSCRTAGVLPAHNVLIDKGDR